MDSNPLKHDQQLGAIVSKAIIDALTPEAQAELLTEAVRSLIAPRDGYDSRTSPLQDAFNGAIREIASAKAREIIAADVRISEKLRDMVVAAWVKAIGNEDKVIDRIASAITSAITGERW